MAVGPGVEYDVSTSVDLVRQFGTRKEILAIPLLAMS